MTAAGCLRAIALAAVVAAVCAAGAPVRARAAPVPAAPDPRLAHMPLIEVPVAPAPDGAAGGDTFVVLYSGDSGWRATTRGFSAALAAAGEPVAGINALRYFLKYRAPAAAADDLSAVIEHYARAWSRPKVILVGYSFGADALPLIVQQLAPGERARVRLVVLVSPTDRADMVFRGVSWFDWTLPGAAPLAPALLTLGPIPAVCIHAAHDPRAACDRFPLQAIRSVALPGNHRYGGQYQAVADIILTSAGLAAPQAPPPSPEPLPPPPGP